MQDGTAMATEAQPSHGCRGITFTAQGLLRALYKVGFRVEPEMLLQAARACGVELPPDATLTRDPHLHAHQDAFLVAVESATFADEFAALQQGEAYPTTFVYGKPDLWFCEACSRFNVPDVLVCGDCGVHRVSKEKWPDATRDALRRLDEGQVIARVVVEA